MGIKERPKKALVYKKERRVVRMEYSLPIYTWFWLLVPNLLIVILSLIRFLKSRGDDR